MLFSFLKFILPHLVCLPPHNKSFKKCGFKFFKLVNIVVQFHSTSETHNPFFAINDDWENQGLNT